MKNKLTLHFNLRLRNENFWTKALKNLTPLSNIQTCLLVDSEHRKSNFYFPFKIFGSSL